MMLVDCQTCPVRDVHCADCMVTALTTLPLRTGAAHPGPDQGSRDRDDPATLPLDRAERRAVSAFLAAGLVTTATANAARAIVAPAARTAGQPGDRATEQRVRRAV